MKSRTDIAHITLAGAAADHFGYSAGPCMKGPALLVGLLIAAVGLVGISVPAFLATTGLRAATPVGLYLIAVARIGFGLVLLGAASASQAPRTLRAFGLVAVVAGLTTTLVGVERAQAIMHWLSSAPIVMRLAAMIAVAIGGFIVYTVSRRPAA